MPEIANIMLKVKTLWAIAPLAEYILLALENRAKVGSLAVLLEGSHFDAELCPVRTLVLFPGSGQRQSAYMRGSDHRGITSVIAELLREKHVLPEFPTKSTRQELLE